MTVDATKVIYASTLNAFKNTGVKSGGVAVAGGIEAGEIADWSTSVTLPEEPKFFTILVKATGLFDTTPRWQPLPSSLYYNVPASGPDTKLAVLLTLRVVGNTVTLIATTLNPFGSTITLSATNIEFKYVPYTLSA